MQHGEGKAVRLLLEAIGVRRPCNTYSTCCKNKMRTASELWMPLLYNLHFSFICSQCSALLKCGRCKFVRYCSKTCQVDNCKWRSSNYWVFTDIMYTYRVETGLCTRGNVEGSPECTPRPPPRTQCDCSLGPCTGGTPENRFVCLPITRDVTIFVWCSVPLPQSLPKDSNWEIDMLCSRMLRFLLLFLLLNFYFSLSLYFRQGWS